MSAMDACIGAFSLSPSPSSLIPALGDEFKDKRDDERVDSNGLGKGDGEDHRGLNFWRGLGVPADGFSALRADKPDAERWAKRAEPHDDADGEVFCDFWFHEDDERLTDERYDLSVRGTRVLVACGVFLHRRRQEHERQHREDDGLHETDENLEEQERQRDDVGNEENNNDEEHFPRKHVPEQPERERDYLNKFGDEFKDAGEGEDGIRDGEELRKVASEADSGDAEDVRGEHGDEGEDEGKVEICRRRAEERYQAPLTAMFSASGGMDADGADAGEESEPIRGEHEEEYGRDQGKKFLGKAPRPEERIHQCERFFQEELEHAL